MTVTQTTQTTQTAVAVEATKLDRIDFYACFTASKIFEELVYGVIPDPKVKKAIEENGIGDNLTLTEQGNYIYDHESGGLLEKPVQEALDALDDEERDQNYDVVCEIAEAYAAFANANALQAAE